MGTIFRKGKESPGKGTVYLYDHRDLKKTFVAEGNTIRKQFKRKVKFLERAHEGAGKKGVELADTRPMTGGRIC